MHVLTFGSKLYSARIFLFVAYLRKLHIFSYCLTHGYYKEESYLRIKQGGGGEKEGRLVSGLGPDMKL